VLGFYKELGDGDYPAFLFKWGEANALFLWKFFNKKERSLRD